MKSMMLSRFFLVAVSGVSSCGIVIVGLGRDSLAEMRVWVLSLILFGGRKAESAFCTSCRSDDVLLLPGTTSSEESRGVAGENPGIPGVVADGDSSGGDVMTP